MKNNFMKHNPLQLIAQSSLFCVLALSVFATHYAKAESTPQMITDATYLRKISFHLRGYQPSNVEYTALASSPNHDAFLKSKIEEYLASPDHAERMLFQLTNSFAFTTPATRDNQAERFHSNYGYSNISPTQDAASDLFRRIGRDNLSWDQLLVGKNYNLTQSENSYYGNRPNSNDFNFLQFVQPQLASYVTDPNQSSSYNGGTSPLAGKVIPVAFAADDARIAGALTTNRFNERYRNSALNKNRRRAAAVFRIFLCDPMSQGFVQEIDKKEDHLSSVFETDATLTEAQLRDNLKGSSAEAQHGKNQSCVGCHYKLDPMGRTFQAMTDVLDDSAAPGALSFKRKNGELVNIPVAGIGGLGQAITQQPEYVSCQVDWFWKEFIGINVPLEENRRQQLMQSFNQVGRRTNDFIKVLLQAPEFRQKPQSAEFISFARVQPLLKRCDSCHDMSATVDAPSFATMPYMDGDSDGTASWLNAINRRLNLPDDHKDHMPRHSEEWSPADIQLLKAWLTTGAHDASGTARLKTANSPNQSSTATPALGAK